MCVRDINPMIPQTLSAEEGQRCPATQYKVFLTKLLKPVIKSCPSIQVPTEDRGCNMGKEKRTKKKTTRKRKITRSELQTGF